jgi:RHH-type proline utilization regulon transcriptional repressor/proline dehydrogenase/delta 1-pyrroline-5-carboxylate dehydrogenase
VVAKDGFNKACRIYAPVGTHKDLLGYLVRRLLENGANSSFVNKLADDTIPMEQLVFDPVARAAALETKPHPRIPLPVNIYGKWKNSSGFDLSNHDVWNNVQARIHAMNEQAWSAAPIINGEVLDRDPQPVVSPCDSSLVIGHVSKATQDDVETALQAAVAAEKTWGTTSVEKRAEILERAGELFQESMPELMAILTREAGKNLFDAMSEVREAIDFCHYYAFRARNDLQPTELPGPTGESNTLYMHPRGTMGCISPWNFPMAIFAGQILAALAAGNPVLAKPAEQTPLIAFKVVQLLHEAGVPKDALQLLIGRGSVVGAKMVSDPRVTGIMFTGSTETAKMIERSLANRSGQIAVLIAETGGQNAMIVDSSALAEQAAYDIAYSAFNSAGQRCSALRVLFVQEEMAPKLLEMLQGYMQTLEINNPALLSTDVGPVIDKDAQNMLQAHYEKMSKEHKLIAQVPMKAKLNGSYFAPCAFEIPSIDVLEGEVFGPILHVIRYPANGLEQVMQSIINTRFGLTLGIHSRIEATTKYITSRMPVGNMYVNRNMIGAVVGVQPFGGERLSGTGPKAGGPHYLSRLCVERTVSINTTAVGGNAKLVSLLESD